MNDIYFAILAGGNGERLWPLSSPKRPKQLIPFINGRSLLEQTLQRVQPLTKSKHNILIVTNNEQHDAIKKVIGKQATLITEPTGRNTAPALLFTCLEVYEKNPDAVIIALPSDHFMPDATTFTSILLPTIAFASCYDRIALLGIKPTHAATGFGYIQYNMEGYVPGWMCFPVQTFHEKPAKEIAAQYIEQPNMLWNSGIFAAKAKTFLQEFQQHAPDLWSSMEAYRKGELEYKAIPSISFDHAIMEKSKQVVVFPADFQWHDVGTLTAFLTLKMHYQKDDIQIVNVMGKNNLACSTKKTVAFVGVNDLCVVETDDVILVVAQEHVETVRQVLPTLYEKENVHDESKLSEVEADSSIPA